MKFEPANGIYIGRGDVVQLTNSAGTVVKSYDYDAYGNETDAYPNGENPFCYCGEYFDVETSTYYLRFIGR